MIIASQLAAKRTWKVRLRFGSGEYLREIESIENTPTALQAVWAAKETLKVDGSQMSGFTVDEIKT